MTWGLATRLKVPSALLPYVICHLSWCFLPVFVEHEQLLCSDDGAQVGVRLGGRGGLQQHGAVREGSAEWASEESGQQPHRGPALVLPASEGGYQH